MTNSELLPVQEFGVDAITNELYWLSGTSIV
jgi:hypothetical protein